MDSEEFLSTQEVARTLQISSRTVRRLVDRGELTPIRVAGSLAFRRSELPGADEQEVEGRPEPLLTIHEAAALLGCPPRTIRALATCGALRTIAFGGTKRWSRANVETARRKGVTHVE